MERSRDQGSCPQCLPSTPKRCQYLQLIGLSKKMTSEQTAADLTLALSPLEAPRLGHSTGSSCPPIGLSMELSD